jgi:hypothetical protein
MKKIILVGVLCLTMVGLSSINIHALTAQNAAFPGETLTNNADATTPIKMKGVFWVLITGTGTGTLSVRRSEDGTNYVTVKTITATGVDKAVYMYESFGDVDSGTGAYYKVVFSDAAVSHVHVRLVR